MTDDAIAWRVERACFAAYPPRAMARAGGWQVARSGGGSRRTNAASAVNGDAILDAATLAGIAALYDADGLPTIVRVTDLVPSASATLGKAGFSAPEGPTRTLLRQLYRDDTFDGGAAAVATAPDAAWLSARRRLGGDIEEPEALAARLSIPVAYARYDDGGLVGAVGYVAICDQIAVLEAIATDPIVRRRGFARTVVGRCSIGPSRTVQNTQPCRSRRRMARRVPFTRGWALRQTFMAITTGDARLPSPALRS